MSAKVAGAWKQKSICARSLRLSSQSIGDCLNQPYLLIPFRFVKMSLFGNDYLRLFRLNFVFHTIGLVFCNVSSFAAIVKKFVYGGKDPEESSENDVSLLSLRAKISVSSTRN